MASSEELAKQKREAVAVIEANAKTLDATIDPKVAREARDRIFEATERAVEKVDVLRRVLDRPVEANA